MVVFCFKGQAVSSDGCNWFLALSYQVNMEKIAFTPRSPYFGENNQHDK